MFHIVFDLRGAELLNSAMDMDTMLDGETVAIRDDYSTGPIQDLFSDTGRTERKKWWSVVREADSNLSPENADDAVLQKILQRMEEEEFDQIWIWMAPNAKDVSGYFWLIAQLGAFAGRVYIISLNNLPFINEKGAVFYPSALSEIPAREFIKAKKLARPVTTAEFETDPDEWIRLSSEAMNLRLLEGGKKIVQKPDDHYDRSILQFLQPTFQKITRTVHQFLLKSADKPNEEFLSWRLKLLAKSGAAELQGEAIRLTVQEADTIDN